MDFSEKWGTDVETAVKLALDDLKLTRDEVDVTVLEEPSRGFFGIGSKLALVRVEKKKPLKVEVPAEKKEEIPAENTAAEEPKPAKAQNQKEHKEHKEKTGSQRHNNKRDRNNRNKRRKRQMQIRHIHRLA